MTKKDYELIADVFNYAFTDKRNDYPTIERIADFMARKLGNENPKFNSVKWSNRINREI